MDTNKFGELLLKLGFRDFIGVPCSYLSPLINYTINNNLFIMSNNEGDAVSIASGISLNYLSNLDSNIGVVLMQNSGLSNALSPLTSLNYTFKIPILGFVSLRGEVDSNGNNTDEPQHELLGRITHKLLDTCEIKYEFLDSNIANAKEQLLRARKYINNRESFFFIVKKGVFDKVKLNNKSEILNIKNKKLIKSKTNPQPPLRIEALQIINEINKNGIILATTGKCGRELYEIQDRENNFYMVGSMGCVSSIALGISIKTSKKIIAIDGDGALLMRLGALSTNAYYAQKYNKGNFCHILLDNESHDSTGGQFNLSPIVDFSLIAHHCGYQNVVHANNLYEFENAIKDFFNSNEIEGATFIYLKIQKGSKENLLRPKIAPKDVALRLSKMLLDS